MFQVPHITAAGDYAECLPLLEINEALVCVCVCARAPCTHTHVCAGHRSRDFRRPRDCRHRQVRQLLHDPDAAVQGEAHGAVPAVAFHTFQKQLELPAAAEGFEAVVRPLPLPPHGARWRPVAALGGPWRPSWPP